MHDFSTLDHTLTQDRNALQWLFPALSSGNRPLPVGQLLRWLLQDEALRKPLKNRSVLLLLGIYYQFSCHYLSDLHAPSKSDHSDASDQSSSPKRILHRPSFPPFRGRWEGSSTSAPVDQLRWSNVPTDQIRPYPTLHAFISGLPVQLVEQCLTWAPPVIVTRQKKDGAIHVVANHVSAVLAKQRLTGRSAVVHRLEKPRAFSADLTAVCTALYVYLKPAFERHRSAIAKQSGSPTLSALLSNYSRSGFYLLKQTAGDAP